MTMANSSDLEGLLLDYMSIESTTGNEGAFADRVCAGLVDDGWFIQKQPISDGSQRYNILATRGAGAVPTVIFNTHMDTVPPYIAPSQDEHNIYGRGSNDAKGQLACMVSAATQLAKDHPLLGTFLGLLFVVGEEVDHVGMIKANEFDISPQYLVVGEPTELKFATIQKGALKVLIRTFGVAGHSGYPSSGSSAIHAIIPILNDIIQHQWPSDKTVGDTTFNIGLIRGGQAQNAWAEAAEANVFFRVTTSVDDVIRQLETIINGRATIERLSHNEPVVLSAAPLDMAVDQVAFNTDLPYYDKLDKLKGKFLFGGGSIKNAHSKDEFMPKKELHACRETLYELAFKLINSAN